jgi:3-carboxy-cis,cis-muconate cycloisomerase
LARRSVVAAAHATKLLTGLQVNLERTAANLAAAKGVLSEQQAMTELTRRAAVPGYTGAADQLIDSALQRARHYLKDTP